MLQVGRRLSVSGGAADKAESKDTQMAKIEPEPKFQLHREVSQESLQAVTYTSLWKNVHTRQQMGACMGLLPQFKDMDVMLTGDMYLCGC